MVVVWLILISNSGPKSSVLWNNQNAHLKIYFIWGPEVVVVWLILVDTYILKRCERAIQAQYL